MDSIKLFELHVSEWTVADLSNKSAITLSWVGSRVFAYWKFSWSAQVKF